MKSRDGRYALVYNGEIYNYRELKMELVSLGVKFYGESDTEVLLSAWQMWGVDSLSKLNGMFAFAVLDLEKGVLTVARDPFGIKPLFISNTAWGLCFASEIEALAVIRNESLQLNLQRSYDYLVYGDYDSNSETFIEGINQIKPGCFVEFDMVDGKGEFREIKWWTPSTEESCELSFSDAAEKLRALFLENIRLHLRSDVPLGAALSGGVDSSAVVCAMRHLEPDMPIHTFSFVAKNSPLSEELWIDKVNSHVGAVSNSVIVESNELANDIDDMIICQGEPFGSTSIYAQYRVFKLAKDRGITVTLDGQGADELLAGYHGYPGKRIKSMLLSGDYSGAIKFLYSWSKWPGRSIIHGMKLSGAEFLGENSYHFARSMFDKKGEGAWLDAEMLGDKGVKLIYPLRNYKFNAPGRNLIKALAVASTKQGLPALLRHADRNSMRFSVESRVPFLTTSLADFAFSLPENYLLSDLGETKHIFRAAMRGLVPDEILDRRDKVGFATPEIEWLSQIFSTSTDWIIEDEEISFLRHDVIRKEFKRVLSGQAPFSMQAWRWINYYKWFKLVYKPLKDSVDPSKSLKFNVDPKIFM